MSASPQALAETAELRRLRRWSMVFTGLFGLWPFAFLGMIFLFEAPGAGGAYIGLLATAMTAYGPLYLIALLVAWYFKRRGKIALAINAWVGLCGVDALLIVLGIVLVSLFP